MSRLYRWLHGRLDRAADALESIGDCPEPNDPTLNPKGPS